jgi:hypothetical protein
MDVYYAIAVATFVMIPLAFLLSKNQPAASGEKVAIH